MADVLAYLDPAPPKYPGDPKICYTSIGILYVSSNEDSMTQNVLKIMN